MTADQMTAVAGAHYATGLQSMGKQTDWQMPQPGGRRTFRNHGMLV
jgi:hypothetical protein